MITYQSIQDQINRSLLQIKRDIAYLKNINNITRLEGEKGDKGDTGERGAFGGTYYIHTQVEAATQWTINHNLNKYPSVVIVDEEGVSLFCDIRYIDANTVIIGARQPISGNAYLT